MEEGDVVVGSDTSSTGSAVQFEDIKHLNPYGAEYWSARDLAPLLGYKKWQNFEVALKRAMESCRQTGNIIEDHFTATSKMIATGKGAQREIKDFYLSRTAAYLIAQNGDPSKREIAEAQAYFVIATRKTELRELAEEQAKRLELRERVSENNKKLAEAAHGAGVLSRSFGLFQTAGYQGLYGGLDVEQIKAVKGVGPREDLLDRMGRAELAANDFRVTLTEERLRKDGIIGQTAAIETHRAVGKTVRRAIEETGVRMPEELPVEPSIKPLLSAKRRERKKNLQADAAPDTDNESTQERLL